jgi:hypothetical protein
VRFDARPTANRRLDSPDELVSVTSFTLRPENEQRVHDDYVNLITG